jgi:hypothetical protein
MEAPAAPVGGVELAITAALLVFTPIWMGGSIGEALALTRPPSVPDDPAYLLVRTELLVGSSPSCPPCWSSP